MEINVKGRTPTFTVLYNRVHYKLMIKLLGDEYHSSPCWLDDEYVKMNIFPILNIVPFPSIIARFDH